MLPRILNFERRPPGRRIGGRHFQRLTYREEDDLSVTSYRQWEEDIVDPNLKITTGSYERLRECRGD